jgi:hypothetical protein
MSRIEIKDKRVSLKAFKHFMSMLDMVLMDESGNLLSMDDADQAVGVFITYIYINIYSYAYF